jgi:hypothetical protein
MTSTAPNRDYYRRLRHQARGFKVDLPAKKWCDLWHTHFDWDGFGNLGGMHRRRHLNALLTALARARVELAAQPVAYQLFAAVYPKSSADDALYVHTRNPNSTPFPYAFEDAVPAAALPPLLAASVDRQHYRVLKSPADGGSCYLLIAQ